MNNTLLDSKKSTNLRNERMAEKILIQTTFKCKPLEYITDAKFIISIHKVSVINS
jgi:hypothetical protein